MNEVQKTCPVCGVGYCLPARYDAGRREDHRAFYCPNGHRLSYRGETEHERTIRELRATIRRRDNLLERRAREIENLEHKVRSLRARLAWAGRRAA